MNNITAEYVRDMYDYNKNTGVFVMKKRIGGRGKIGKIAGCLASNGYIIIHSMYGHIKAHRMAWLYVYGVEAPGHIDHINGDRSDNRICNLRIATMRENAQNMECHRNGKLCGASYDKRRGTWESYYNIGNKKIHIGRYATEGEAHEAYKNAIDARRKEGPRMILALFDNARYITK